MEATHGFAFLFRLRMCLRTCLIGCSMAVVLAFAALLLASSARAAEPPHKTYLALGDSVAFGYSQELFNVNVPEEPPKAFEEAVPRHSHIPNGYVLDYNEKLKASSTETSRWQNKAVNEGCPGETTDSLEGSGSLRAQMEAAGLPINPTASEAWIKGAWFAGTTAVSKVSTLTKAACGYKYVNKFQLHHEYGEGQSQLENALEVIKSHGALSSSSNPVATITLGIGANDQLADIRKCEGEVKEEFEGKGSPKGYNPGNGEFEPGPGESKYNKVPFTTPEKQATEAHTPENAQTHCLEAHLGEAFSHILHQVASVGFVLRNASLFCVTGAPPCEAAQHGVDYAGKFIFVGDYNPYGSVFQENHELLAKSNTLAGLLNQDTEQVVERPEFGVDGCFANPQVFFNPKILGSPQLEWGEGEAGSLVLTGHGGQLNAKNELVPDPSPFGTLQKYTNMANFRTDRGLKFGEKEADGPDIHPTPLGYQEIANTVAAFCP
jgi:hypothetical protein